MASGALGEEISAPGDDRWAGGPPTQRALDAALLDHASEFHCLSDDDGRITWVSETIQAVLGIDARHHLGTSLWDLAHPDDVERCRTVGAALVDEPGGRRRLQYRVRHADNTWRWVETIATNHRGRPGLDGVLWTSRDVSSRTAAKHRLAVSERRLRSIVSSAGDIIAILDERGDIDYITPTVATLLGRSTSMVQSDWVSLLHPDDLEAMSALFAWALEEPGVTRGPVDLRLMSSDGSWVTVEALFTDFRADPIVRGIVLNARDVTERRSAERESQANQDVFNALVEMAPVGIFLADRANHWTYVNERAAEFFGVDASELGGAGWMGHFHTDDLVAVRNQLAAWDGRGVVVSELRTLTAEPRELRMTMSRPANADRSGSVVGTLEDVTDRRAVDDMLLDGAALGSVAGLVGGAAHDLHNLLSSVGMQIDLLHDAGAPDDRTRAAEQALDQACEIADDLMALGRPSGGRMQPIVLGPMIETLTGTLRVLVDHQADLAFEDRSDGERAVVDRSGLERVLTNLVVNARDAVDAGGQIKVTVATDDIAESEVFEGGAAGRHLAIHVSDDGSGIPDAYMDRVFEPHFTTKADGNGIGLAASRRNVRLWHGDIQFTSEAGQGTTFTVLLPVM